MVDAVRGRREVLYCGYARNIEVYVTRRCVLIPESEYGDWIGVCCYPYRGRWSWRIWHVMYPPFRFVRHIRCFVIEVTFTLNYLKRKDPTRNIHIEVTVSCIVTEEMLNRKVGFPFSPEALLSFLEAYIENIQNAVIDYVEEVYGDEIIREGEWEFGVEFKAVCPRQECQCVLKDFSFARGKHGELRYTEEPASRQLKRQLQCFNPIDY